MIYLNLCGFYLTLQKCLHCRKYFSENFDILYAYIIFLLLFVFILFVGVLKKNPPLRLGRPSSQARPRPSPARPSPRPRSPAGDRLPHADRRRHGRRVAPGLFLPLLHATSSPPPLKRRRLGPLSPLSLCPAAASRRNSRARRRRSRRRRCSARTAALRRPRRCPAPPPALPLAGAAVRSRARRRRRPPRRRSSRRPGLFP